MREKSEKERRKGRIKRRKKGRKGGKEGKKKEGGEEKRMRGFHSSNESPNSLKYSNCSITNHIPNHIL